jgi:predicted CXXCH cytochrome family protein
VKGTRWRATIAVAGAVVLVAMGIVLAGVVRADAGGNAVVIGGVRPESPAVSGTKVVFADRRYGSYDIFMYDALTGRTSRLTNDLSDQIDPVINGDTVVWSDLRNGTEDIYTYVLSTGTLTRLTNWSGRDERFPAISDGWIAWQSVTDGGYSPSIYAYSRTAGGMLSIGTGSGPFRGRPQVAGNLLVWEERASGRDDCDVMSYDLAGGGSRLIAGTSLNEGSPATDGRYIVYAKGTGTGADIRAYDSTTGRDFVVCSDAGEQLSPKVSAGVAYWTDNQRGRPLHVDSCVLATGARAPLPTYGTGDVAGFCADGANATWLERDRARWQVRGLFNEGTSLVDRLTQVLPLEAPLNALQLASLSVGDETAPEVVSTSIQPGQRNVARNIGMTVYFSEALSPATVNAHTIRLVDNRTGRDVRARLRYAALTNSVTLKPLRPLGPTSYTLYLEPTLTDKSGNPLALPRMVSFSTVNALVDNPPTAPGAQRALVSGLTSVAINWDPAVDDVMMGRYTVKRHYAPIDEMNWGAASLVADVASSTTAITTATAANERSRDYTYYYAIRAYDAAGNPGPISANLIPDPHGTWVTGANTKICTQCHAVHGAPPNGRQKLGAKSAGACYECHGNTNATVAPNTSAYGSKSTLDTQYDFQDDSAIASLGPNYADRSVHRDSYVVANQTECDMCHSPHRRPSDWLTGGYNPSTSYPKLLRANPAYEATYLAGNGTYDEGFCWGCHGASGQSFLNRADITNGKGTEAFSSSGGDHETGFTNSSQAAHRAAIVPATPRPTGDTTGPVIGCTACHDKHAATASVLIDYRGRKTPDTRYAQSGLCFECHAASGNGAEETLSVGSRPYAWNGRDTYAEFQRASHHPTAAMPPPPAPTAVEMTWTQSALAEFADGNTELSQTVATATAGGAIELDWQNLSSTVTTYFFPTSDIAAGSWTTNAGGTTLLWDRVNDPVATPDNATTYIRGQNTTEYQANVTAPNLPASATNISVKLVARLSSNGGSDFWVRWRQNGTWRSGTTRTLLSGQAWTSYEETVANPAGGAWTPAAAKLITGLGCDTSNTEPWCTQLYLAITYDVPGETGYYSTGTAVSQVIPTDNGTLDHWDALDLHGYEPAGTTITIDVIDVAGTGLPIPGYTGLRLSDFSSPLVLSGLNPTYKFVQLRATLSADPPPPIPAPTPRSVVDAYADNSFDVAKWTDGFLGGSTPPGAGWPREATQTLSLRAEGAGFRAATDEGEFTYVRPSATTTWVATSDFDMRVYVGAVRSNVPSAGLMVRTGGTESAATATAAAMLGLYLPPYVPPPSAVDTSWAQTTQTEFRTDDFSLTTAAPTGGGAIELEWVNNQQSFDDNYNPTADGDRSGTWSYSTGSTGWNLVDDYPVLNTTDRVVSPTTNNSYFLWTSAARTLPADANNIQVIVTYSSRKDTSGSGNTCTAGARLKVGGSYYTSGTVAVNASTYTDNSVLYPVNPKTGVAWTVADITGASADPLQQFGVEAVNVSNMAVRVPEVYLTVTYETGDTGYNTNGTAISTLIPTTGGVLNQWQWLRVNGNEPANTTMTVDVLDGSGQPILGYTDLQYPSDFPKNLIGLNTAVYPFIMLKATMEAPTQPEVTYTPAPRSVVDTFTDNSFDSANTWTDVFIGASTDPDYVAPVATTDYSYTIGDITAGSWQTAPLWSDVNEVQPLQAGTGDATYIEGRNTTRCEMAVTTPTVPAGATNIAVTLNYRWAPSTNSGTSCNVTPAWRQGASTWTAGTQRTLTNTTTRSNVAQAVTPSGGGNWTSATVNQLSAVGFTTTRTGSPYPRVYQAYLEITYDVPQTQGTTWPREATQTLSLRAEGAGFRATADSGEFTYVKPSAADWISAGDFDARLWVGDLRSNNASAGIQVRTGASENAATATAPVMLGVYLSDTPNAVFAGRTAAGGNTTNFASQANTAAPEWLRLVRIGNTFAAFCSNDASNSASPVWTRLGTTQTVTMNSTVLLGIGLASNSDGNYSEADFDNFSVTELTYQVTIPESSMATQTPSLTDWTVDYGYTPPPPSNTPGLLFQSRTTAGGSTSTNATAAVTAPAWLRLTRVGNEFTAYYSQDASNVADPAWTRVASRTVDMTTSVLAGLALTSSSNGSYSEADYDNFSLTEITYETPTGLIPKVTPSLYDWTVTYAFVPAQEVQGAGVTCANCHNVHVVTTGTVNAWTMSRTVDPDNTKNAFTATPTDFCLKCHDGNPPAATVQANTIVPYPVGFSVMPTATYPFFPGWDKKASATSFTGSGHWNSGVTRMQVGCDNCHDPHSSASRRLLALTASSSANASHLKVWRSNDTTTYSEENLCFACHGSSRTPNCAGGACHPNIDSYAAVKMNVQSVMPNTSGHYVAKYWGRHTDTETASKLATGFAGNVRHVECTDCHDAHGARSGVHTAGTSNAGNVLIGGTGLRPSYVATNWGAASSFAPIRIENTSTDIEAYVCFKCHSSSAGMPATVTVSNYTYKSTDIAMEFNPNNQSGHNVLGVATWPKTSFLVNGSTYTWSLPSDASFLKSPWTRSSKVTCSDCHTYGGTGARGPHGSTVKYMIDSGYTTLWDSSSANLDSTTGIICAKCHTNFGNMNGTHSESDHGGSTDGRCVACHVKVPHGWKRPRLLGYTTDPEPYRSLNLTGITLKSYTYNNWDENDCGQTGCDEHSGSPSGTKWP